MVGFRFPSGHLATELARLLALLDPWGLSLPSPDSTSRSQTATGLIHQRTGHCRDPAGILWQLFQAPGVDDELQGPMAGSEGPTAALGTAWLPGWAVRLRSHFQTARRLRTSLQGLDLPLAFLEQLPLDAGSWPPPRHRDGVWGEQLVTATLTGDVEKRERYRHGACGVLQKHTAE